MIDVFILKIDKDLEKDLFENLLNFTSPEKRERIARFHFFEDAQRSLLGDLLARYALCKRLMVRNCELAFGANEYGKPILLDPQGIYPKTQFNISHSGKYVACAVDDEPIGIDVETIKETDLKIAQRFFAKEEYFSLMDQPEENRLKYFFLLWTLKESYIKAEGKGLSIPLNSFSVRVPHLPADFSADSPADSTGSCGYFPVLNTTVTNSSGSHSVKTGKIPFIRWYTDSPCCSVPEVAKKNNSYRFYQALIGDEAVCAICARGRFFRNFTYFTIENFLAEIDTLF